MRIIMNNREKFHAAMAFEKTDTFCHVEHGFWDEAYNRWKNEGLPDYVEKPDTWNPAKGIDLYKYCGVAKIDFIRPGIYFKPAGNFEVLEEDDNYRVIKDENGVIMRFNKRNVSLPQYLDYPIKSKKDYEDLKDRLVPDIKSRYPKDWDNIAYWMRNQGDSIICSHMDGLFGYPRALMGVEKMLYMFYDDPEFMRTFINDIVDFYIILYEKGIREAKPDFGFIGEDMCYKNGPLVSPAIFKEFFLPAYKKLTGFLRDMGVNNIIIDSDGNVRKLIPLWMEGGITGLLPFEVNAGMDVVKIGEVFPTLQIFGGISKHEIAKGRQAIDVELDRVLPYMKKRGGYCVSLDHHVPPDISLEDYMYYVERVQCY